MSNTDVLTMITGNTFILILALVMLVIIIVANWKIFNKFGEPGWKCIIPVYNSYIEYKYSWKTSYFWIMIVLSIASGFIHNYCAEGSAIYIIGSIVGAVASIIGLILMYKLSKAFGHGIGWFIGLVLLNPIFVLMLGFGKSQYIGINRDYE